MKNRHLSGSVFICSGRELGDEYHYIFECTQSTNETKLYIDYMSSSPNNVIKYNNLNLFKVNIVNL